MAKRARIEVAGKDVDGAEDTGNAGEGEGDRKSRDQDEDERQERHRRQQLSGRRRASVPIVIGGSDARLLL